MFDIAFSEIVIIAVVALIVIGPERLPKTAKTLGLLFGRLQRYVSDVKADINRELQLEELRKLQADVQSAARDIESTVANAAHEIESGSRKLESELNAAPEAPPLPPPADVPAPTAAAGKAAPSGAAADVPVAPKPDEAAPAQGSLPGFERG
jgi:sec-independent protein translocase protein TatB